MKYRLSMKPNQQLGFIEMFPSKQIMFVFVILFLTSFICKVSVGLAAVTGQRSMPIMARKAGGTWKQELTETADIHKVTDEKEYLKNKNSRTKMKRPKCYDDEYYHALGNQCVPKQCPGGNRNRNKDTGECTWDGIIRNNYISYRRQYVYRSIRSRKRGSGFSKAMIMMG